MQGYGLAVAFARVFNVLNFDLLGVVAAAVAATAAWIEAKDHATLGSAYGITATDLWMARERALMLANNSSEPAWSNFVETAELAKNRHEQDPHVGPVIAGIQGGFGDELGGAVVDGGEVDEVCADAEGLCACFEEID